MSAPIIYDTDILVAIDKLVHEARQYQYGNRTRKQLDDAKDAMFAVVRGMQQELHRVRGMLHDVETRTDPAGEVRERVCLAETATALWQQLEELRKAVTADIIDGRREVDKELAEHGYDSMQFALVRHGWLFSTTRVREQTDAWKALAQADDLVKVQAADAKLQAECAHTGDMACVRCGATLDNARTEQPDKYEVLP